MITRAVIATDPVFDHHRHDAALREPRGVVAAFMAHRKNRVAAARQDHDRRARVLRRLGQMNLVLWHGDVRHPTALFHIFGDDRGFGTSRRFTRPQRQPPGDTGPQTQKNDNKESDR